MKEGVIVKIRTVESLEILSFVPGQIKRGTHPENKPPIGSGIIIQPWDAEEQSHEVSLSAGKQADT
jgi:hypothetical protein